MAIDYARMKQTATRLLTENGIKRDFIRPGGVVRVNGVETKVPDTTYQVAGGVITSWNPREIDGKTILSGDRKLVCTSDIDIKVGDRLVDGSEVWRVENPNPVKPAAIVLCYKLQLRKV